MKPKLLLCDDDAQMLSLLKDYLEAEGYQTESFSDGSHLLEKLAQPDFAESIDLIISDINMELVSGLELASEVRKHFPKLPVILMTAFGSIESAIEAMRKGAYDYIVKPFKLAEMGLLTQRAVTYRRLETENEILRKEVRKNWSVGGLIGRSVEMRAVYDLIERVAKGTANILIQGESGTGKEMVARAIHESGPRKSNPFVAVNCGAIPENLLESELFGHAKGSFTGANQRKIGLFEEANSGTLFLDEIGDMDPALQTKLLRVLQEKKIRPVGDNQLRDVDVRVVAATHRDLAMEIEKGKFREDLYYRLNVIPIHVPALRERPGDIALLAAHFLKKYAAANGSQITGFSREAMAKLERMPWRGNVRELENLIERLVVLGQGTQIEEQEIPEQQQLSSRDILSDVAQAFPTIAELEKRYVELVLQKTGGKKDQAAKILGINRRTLYRKEHDQSVDA